MIPIGGPLVVLRWVFGSRTAWLVKKSAGQDDQGHPSFVEEINQIPMHPSQLSKWVENVLWFRDVLNRQNEKNGWQHFLLSACCCFLWKRWWGAANEEVFINSATGWNVLILGYSQIGLAKHIMMWQLWQERKVRQEASHHGFVGHLPSPTEYKWLNYAVGPVENEDIFFSPGPTLGRLLKPHDTLMTQWKICLMFVEPCTMCRLVSVLCADTDVLDRCPCCVSSF